MGKEDGKPGVAVGPVKLTTTIPGEIDIRLFALAKSEGCRKQYLVAKFLEAGLIRYKEDRHFRDLIAGLIATPGEAA